MRPLLASLLSVLLLYVLGCSRAAYRPDAQSQFANCQSTREYVTALEFLRSQKEFAQPEPQLQKMAEQVAAACDGSARRFVRVTQLLTKSTFPIKQALDYGILAATLSDDQTEAFLRIFRSTYASSKLDLDPRSSAEIAKRLSFDYKGNPKRAADDFGRIVEFCVSPGGIDLPKGACSELAARVAKLGEKYDHNGYGELWVEGFKMITSQRGPGRSTAEALQVAEEILASGPEGIVNFRDGYRYALSEKGLKLSEGDAFQFAKRMAKLSSVKRERD